MNKLLILALGAAALTGGCQSADPASRSNRSTYGDITARIEGGNSNSVSITIGDGLYADASGGGDTQSNAPTQTTDTKPEVAVGVGGGSAGTGGATPSSGIVGKALETLMSRLTGGSADTITADEAAAVKAAADAAVEDQSPK
jgi:hypothetical protein